MIWRETVEINMRHWAKLQLSFRHAFAANPACFLPLRNRTEFSLISKDFTAVSVQATRYGTSRRNCYNWQWVKMRATPWRRHLARSQLEPQTVGQVLASGKEKPRMRQLRLLHRFCALTVCASCPWTSPCSPGPAEQSPARPPPAAWPFLRVLFCSRRNECQWKQRETKRDAPRCNVTSSVICRLRETQVHEAAGQRVRPKTEAPIAALVLSCFVLFCLHVRSVSWYSPSSPKFHSENRRNIYDWFLLVSINK